MCIIDAVSAGDLNHAVVAVLLLCSDDAACAGDLNHAAVDVLVLCVLMTQLVLGI